MSNSSTPLTIPLPDEDLETLRTWIVQTASGFGVYGVQGIVSFITSSDILSQGIQNSKSRLLLFITTILLLLTSTSITVFDIKSRLLQLPLNNGFEPQGQPPNLEDVLPILKNFQIAKAFFERLNYLFGEGSVVWRTWNMYRKNLWARIFLIFCMFSSCVCAFNDAIQTSGNIQDSNFSLEGSDGTAKKFKLLTTTIPSFSGVASIASTSNTKLLLTTIPLLATNIVSTSMVGYQAWLHRRDILQNLSLSKRNNDLTYIKKIISFLVESGVIYCIFWVIYTFLAIFMDSENSAFEAYSTVMPSIAALNTVLIILIATRENPKPSKTEKTLSQIIRFANDHTLDDSHDGRIFTAGQPRMSDPERFAQFEEKVHESKCTTSVEVLPVQQFDDQEGDSKVEKRIEKRVFQNTRVVNHTSIDVTSMSGSKTIATTTTASTPSGVSGLTFKDRKLWIEERDSEEYIGCPDCHV